MVRTLVLVSTPIKEGLAESIAAGKAPRRDYFELRDMMDAELMFPPSRPGSVYRLLSKVGGNALAMAVAAWASRDQYDVVLTDQEAVGLLLGMLFKVSRTRRGHVMISHYLTPGKKQIFYRLLRVQSHIDRTICYSTAQEKVAREKLRLTNKQVSLVLHPADSKFWRPVESDSEREEDQELLCSVGLEIPSEVRVICSAGLEFRDYPTLMKAARLLPKGTQVVIAASSPWSKRKNTAKKVEIPENVRLVSLKPLELRALYRRAYALAIPLSDVDFQAGSLVAYEGMACGKPVVITRTRGQGDIVKENETGLYVRPGDSNGMASALNQLLLDPRIAERMGKQARRVVEEGLNLDTYLAEMARLVREVSTRHSPAPAKLRRVVSTD